LLEIQIPIKNIFDGILKRSGLPKNSSNYPNEMLDFKNST
jgi:hypothetical protein